MLVSKVTLYPYPDFDGEPYKCLDCSDVRAWAKDHQLPGVKDMKHGSIAHPGEKIHEDFPQ